jgi:hypothetical protein
MSPASVKEEEVQPQMQCSLLTALDSVCTGRIRPSQKYSVLDETQENESTRETCNLPVLVGLQVLVVSQSFVDQPIYKN